MSWVRIDDHLSEHPKFQMAGPLAGWLYICALQYASRNMTDGLVPFRAVPTLVNFEGVAVTVATIGTMAGVGDDVDPYVLAGTLVDVGLWEQTERGFQIHDYLEFNPSKAEVLAQRQQNAARQASWQERRRANAVTNAVSNGVNNAVSNAVTNSVANGVNNSPLTPAPYPVPVPVPVTSRYPVPDPGEAAATAAAETAAARPQVGLVDISEDARTVLEEWRRFHGKRSPPKLNPTQVHQLEEAVIDLGVARLVEAAEYTATKGLKEFHKCLSCARTKRQQDEARELPPSVVRAVPPRSPKWEAEYQAAKRNHDAAQPR